jgi:CelD/BcsL family acetyltransferase involved in cellulose biosynthesis
MAPITLHDYSPGMTAEWNSFVETADNGTLFHRLDFLAYHATKFSSVESHQVWRKGRELFAVMPMAILNENGRRVARSPYGASWAGLVHRSGLKLKYAMEMVEILVDRLKAKGVDECIVTVPPVCYFSEYTNYVEFAMAAVGFALVNRDITHVAHLPGTAKAIWDAFDSKCRNQTRNGQRRFTHCPTATLDDFYRILVQDKARHGTTSITHSLTNLRYLRDTFDGRIEFDVATQADGARAGICTFRMNDRAMLTFYLAQEDAALGGNGLNALIARSMERAVESGVRHYDFGTSTDRMRIGNIGVTEFKESFGAVGQFRDTYKVVLR